MEKRFCFSACLIGMLVVFFASCSRFTQAPSGQYLPHISYELSIPSVDTVHVAAVFSFPDEGNTFKILFPPFKADNPAITFLGGNIHGLKLTNATIADSLRPNEWLGDSVQSMLIYSQSSSFSMEYDVTFPYAPNGSAGYKTILPGRYGVSQGYYQGNYLFCVPASGATTASWWRGNLDAAVEISYPASGAMRVYGVPAAPFSCSNAYELFFIQFGITGQQWPCGGGGGSTTSSIIALSATQPDQDAMTLICSDLAGADDICKRYYPLLGGPRTVILQDSGSGMEGLFSFYMANWSYQNFIASFRPVITHEALHSWIGIRTGDLDDPWWKEGTASYLGRVLGANVGFPKDSLRPQLVKDLSANKMTNQKALSDAYVRQYLYDGDTNRNCLVLVYDKGAQACMILDKMIRQATGNTSTLFSKTGALCTRYDHSAFSRGQFKTLMEENTGLDFSDFFTMYIDKPGIIDTAVLSGAWHFLDSCGAFSGRP